MLSLKRRMKLEKWHVIPSRQRGYTCSVDNAFEVGVRNFRKEAAFVKSCRVRLLKRQRELQAS